MAGPWLPENSLTGARRETLERMLQQVYEWDAVEDRRAIFLVTYAMMTKSMTEALSSGGFDDSDWVDELLRHFADYYFNALAAYETDGSAPMAWRRAHDLTRERGILAQEHLLLGVNAHINHDLALAVSDLLAREWSGADAELRQSRESDFMAVNGVIGGLMEDVEHVVCEEYDHRLGVVERHLGPLMSIGEAITRSVISSWRAEVWSNAVKLAEAADRYQRALLVESIEEGSLHRVHVILAEAELRAELLAMTAGELRKLHFLKGIGGLRDHPELAGDPECAEKLRAMA